MTAAPIIVTGPRGLLGATLLHVLPGAVSYEGDVRELHALAAYMSKVRPSWVVHTAAITDVGACEREPDEAHAVNAEGARQVVEAARAVGARVLYVSTASVFKGDRGDCREEETPVPLNVYNKTKREGELHTLSYTKGLVLRLNLIGVHPKGSRGKNFLEWLLDSIRADKNLKLFSDSFINPLSNWTIAEYIGRIIRSGTEEKILHIGSSDVRSKEDIGRMVLKKFPDYRGMVHSASSDSIQDGVLRPKQMWLNTDKAAALLGPMPTLEQELEKILKISFFEKQQGL